MSEKLLTMQELSEYERLKNQREKRLARQNDYNKNNYDRLSVVLKKGEREKIETHYKSKGFSSFNEYAKHLIYNDMGETTPQ